MKDKIVSNRRLLLVLGLLLATFVVLASRLPNRALASTPTYSIVAPDFVTLSTDTANSANDGIRTVTQEAGITFYADTNRIINLNSVRPKFRTIESGGEPGDTYLIGSVPVTDYGDNEDVHVYVDTEGWIVAYYPISDPVGKILDWKAIYAGGSTGVSTKLENTFGTIADAIGASVTNATYYDFRTPDATKMTIVYEGTTSDDSFTLTIPSEFDYYNIGWSSSLYDSPCCGVYRNAKASLDGVDIANMWADGTWVWDHGTLALSEDVEHVLRIYDAGDVGYISVILLYSE